MNVLDTIRGLVRRWYISVPGLILAAVAVVGVWQVTPPEYERSASQLLLPGLGVLPEGATNRFLFIGGLAPVADVLVRAVSSDDALNEILREHPNTQVHIIRDPTASGPVVLTTVTARDDAHIGEILDEVLTLTSETLERLQGEEGIPTRDRVTMNAIAIGQESTTRDRDRLVTSAAVGLGVALLTVVLASVVDGLVVRSRRRKTGAKESKQERRRAAEESEPEAPTDAEWDSEVTPETPLEEAEAPSEAKPVASAEEAERDSEEAERDSVERVHAPGAARVVEPIE